MISALSALDPINSWVRVVFNRAKMWSTFIVDLQVKGVSSRDDRAEAKDAVRPQTPKDWDDLERVGCAVAARRVELGFDTQAELASAAGVALNTAALLERGKTWPQRANRTKLEDALQWPHGTLEAVRTGSDVPRETTVAAPPRPAPVAPVGGAARTDLQALTIAKAVAAIAATCAEVLLRERSEKARATLRQLDDLLLQLESLITATLPHLVGSSWSETMSAAAQLHEYREVIRDAAQQAHQQRVG